MKILVAEDEPAIAESYKLILEHSGHQVIVVKDGAECLDVFLEHCHSAAKKSGVLSSSPFDIVILDYRMPIKDGVLTASEIRTLVPSQRILLATAYTHEVSVAKLQESPKTKSVELLQKPFEFDHFLKIIERNYPQNLSTIAHKTTRFDKSNPSNLQFVPSEEHAGVEHGQASDTLSMQTDTQGLGFSP